MTGHTLALVELVLVLGGVLGWALWELWTVRRQLRQDRERRPPPLHDDAPPPPPQRFD